MLHTISQSQTKLDTERLLALIAPKDAVLLWQDGVYIAARESYLLTQLVARSCAVYGLVTDIQARGLSQVTSPHVQVIDMAQCVILTANHHPQLAW